MSVYRNGNYSAFYVAEPFHEGNLGAYQAADFRYYNMLRMWKRQDSSFPFIDSHQKNYNVRDGSDWERTLKPRLRERLRNSKNIVLFLSSVTRNSKALREEIDYGINTLGLPVIVVYPEFDTPAGMLTQSHDGLDSSVRALWGNLPVFRDSMSGVPTLHVPLSKAHIEWALRDTDFTISSPRESGSFFYTA